MSVVRLLPCVALLAGCPVYAFLYPQDTETAACRTGREYRTNTLPDAGGCRAVCPQHREFTAELEECYVLEDADPDAGIGALWHCQYIV